MNDVIALFGSLFIIVMIQIIIDMFLDDSKRPFLSKMLGAACYAAALFVVLKFILDNLLPQIYNVFNISF